MNERDLWKKIVRIEMLAEEAGNQLYVDTEGHRGSIDECRRLLNEIIKECEEKEPTGTLDWTFTSDGRKVPSGEDS